MYRVNSYVESVCQVGVGKSPASGHCTGVMMGAVFQFISQRLTHSGEVEERAVVG
jgi:hypothetical protein